MEPQTATTETLDAATDRDQITSYLHVEMDAATVSQSVLEAMVAEMVAENQAMGLYD